MHFLEERGISVSSGSACSKGAKSHVLSAADISFAQAALGADIEVPTLDGKVKLTIPEGTQPGSVFRLRDVYKRQAQRKGACQKYGYESLHICPPLSGLYLGIFDTPYIIYKHL